MKPSILQKAAMHCSAGHLCNGCEFVHIPTERHCAMKFAQALLYQYEKAREREEENK